MIKKQSRKTAKGKKAKKKKISKSNNEGKRKNEPSDIDTGIIIIDDDFRVDKDAILEERRAYLEEARSQEAFD